MGFGKILVGEILVGKMWERHKGTYRANESNWNDI